MDKFETLMQEIAFKKKQALYALSTSPAMHIIHRCQGAVVLLAELEEIASKMTSGEYEKEQEIQKRLDNE